MRKSAVGEPGKRTVSAKNSPNKTKGELKKKKTQLDHAKSEKKILSTPAELVQSSSNILSAYHRKQS